MIKTTSSMDATDINRSGRPFGGCLIMWKRSIEISVKSIVTTSGDLRAYILFNTGLTHLGTEASK